MNRAFRRAVVAALITLVGGSLASAQVIDLSQTGPSGTAFQWVGPQANAQAGTTLYRADMNGDGRVDMVVGSPFGGSAGQGQAFIQVMGPPRTGTISLGTSNVVLTGEAAGDRFGVSLGAGMIFHEEVDPLPARDLIIGASNAFGGKGAVYAFGGPFASAESRSAAAATLKVIGAAGDQLGASIDAADIDGDGFRDIIMAAPGSGRIYVIYGGPTLSGTWDLSTKPADVTMSLPVTTLILNAEDFNRDGFKDLAVGVPQAANGAGVVLLFMGRARAKIPSSMVLASIADATIIGAQAGDALGTALEIADLSGEGIYDLVASAPGASGPGGRAGAGAVYVFLGSTQFGSPTLASATTTIYGAGSGHHIGLAMSHGNARRDLQDDLAIVAPGASAAGDIDVVYGRPRSAFPPVIDLASNANRVLRTPTPSPARSVLILDITGEGAQDIVVGVPNGTGAGNAAAGVLYAVYSPILVPGRRITTMSAAQGSSASARLDILNNGTMTVSWAARSDTAWLSLASATGSSSNAAPGSVTLNASPGSLPVGVYHGGLTYVSRAGDLLWAENVEVDLTVTAGVTTAPLPSNPFGVPTPPDQGSPNGVSTAVGANVAVLPVNDVLVTFASVTSAGTTQVDISSNTNASGPGFKWGPWFYRISTTAVVSGPVTIAIAYDPGLVVPKLGTIRLWGGITQKFDTAKNIVYGSAASLPTTVTVANDIVNMSADFTNDGDADLLFESLDGHLAAWAMNGTSFVRSLTLGVPQVDSAWRIVAAADLNGDGKPDLLWQHRDGWLAAWYMDGTTFMGAATLAVQRVDPNWHIAAAADLNGDGKADLIWQHTDGRLAAWIMDGPRFVSSVFLGVARTDPLWHIVGAADVDGDGKPDLLWEHRDGWLAAWIMNGTSFVRSATLGATRVDPNWTIVATADINHDGKVDLVFQHQNGSLAVWMMNGTTIINVRGFSPSRVGGGWRIVGPR